MIRCIFVYILVNDRLELYFLIVIVYICHEALIVGVEFDQEAGWGTEDLSECR